MNQKEIDILQTLAQGVDYETGEVLPQDSILQRPEVIRALFLACTYLNRSDQKKTNRNARPGKAGTPWTSEEDQELIKAFEANTPISAIALQHLRTNEGIAARLVRLGKINDRKEVLNSK